LLWVFILQWVFFFLPWGYSCCHEFVSICHEVISFAVTVGDSCILLQKENNSVFIELCAQGIILHIYHLYNPNECTTFLSLALSIFSQQLKTLTVQMSERIKTTVVQVQAFLPNLSLGYEKFNIEFMFSAHANFSSYQIWKETGQN